MEGCTTCKRRTKRGTTTQVCAHQHYCAIVAFTFIVTAPAPATNVLSNWLNGHILLLYHLSWCAMRNCLLLSVRVSPYAFFIVGVEFTISLPSIFWNLFPVTSERARMEKIKLAFDFFLLQCSIHPSQQWIATYYILYVFTLFSFWTTVCACRKTLL